MDEHGCSANRQGCPPEHTNRRPRLLGVGLACLDYVFLSPWAKRGGQAQVRDHVVCGGGLVGTAIVTAARLGAETALWGWVGEDDEGQQVIAGLQAEGVDTSGVEVAPGTRTPVSFVHVDADSGERTIYHRAQPVERVCAGSPESGRPAASVADRPLACDVLLVDAIWPEASIAAARRAREMGMPVVGDFCPEGEGAELARFVTHLIVPRACGERLAPGASPAEQLRKLIEFGPGFAAITAGPEGCWFVGRAGRSVGRGNLACPAEDVAAISRQSAFPVEVVDTTGAGDVFHGAFAYALARRWPMPKCVELASAAAALSCRALGGRTAIPRLEEVVAFIGGRSPRA